MIKFFKSGKGISYVVICIIKLITVRAPSQYPIIRLIVRSRKVSKPRDLYLELSDRSEIWQARRQHCCRCACQISKRYGNLKYQSRGFETSWDLTIRRLFGYWDGSLMAFSLPCQPIISVDIWKNMGGHLGMSTIQQFTVLVISMSSTRSAMSKYANESWIIRNDILITFPCTMELPSR